MRKIKKRAFTLIELIIVMTVISILVASVFFYSNGATDGATITKIISDLRTVKTAIAIISLDTKKKNVLLGDGRGSFIEWYKQGITIKEAVSIETGTATPKFGTGELLAKHTGGKSIAGGYIYGSGTLDGEDVLLIGKATFGEGTLEVLKANKDILPVIFLFDVNDDIEGVPDLENYTGSKVINRTTNPITDPESGYAIFMAIYV